MQMSISQIVHVLKSGDDDYLKVGDRDEQNEAIGTMEMVRYPGQTLEERVAEETARRAKVPPPMLWFSHKFPGGEGEKERVGIDPRKNPKIKYILITRNGREIVKSFFPFINAHTDKFRQMWGGFPPKWTRKEEALEFTTTEQPQFYFGYVKAWWEYR